MDDLISRLLVTGIFGTEEEVEAVIHEAEEALAREENGSDEDEQKKRGV